MTEIKLPAMSPTMEEGTLAKWLVKEGDTVKPGDVLAEIETDKATMELEADDGGVVEKLHVAAGSDGVKVGTLIATIRGEDDVAAPKAEPAAATPPLTPPVPGGGSAGAKVSPPANEGHSTDAGVPLPEREGLGVGIRPEAPTQTDATPAPTKAETSAKPKDGETPASLAVQPQVAPGTKLNRQTVREALRDAMAEEMRADPMVFVMGEEVAEYQGAYKVTQGLLEEFGPARVVDTPITEYGFAGLGTGAAMGGLKPIVEFMTFNFAMQAIDHIINSAAKTNYMSGGQMRCPMVFRGPNGAASRVAAQHSQNYAPWYASVPGLIVIAPYSAADAKGLLKSAIRSPDPVVFLENELLYGHSFDVPEGDIAIPIGKAAVVREGKDVTLVSYSIGVGVCLDAATKLAEAGIEAEIVDLRTLRPLDKATVLASLKKTNRMVVVEEGWPTCSIASEIIAIAMVEGFDDLDAPVLRVTNEDVPLPYAANLEKLALLKVEDVIEAAKKVCYR
ncbi:pyruvate dehydrogenase complex E1 component subunit beta [Sphingosinicellaceae bacterium]|nr:pyruvate dehydrogenase complex E1 component subunit beta [Sphingosinicellaceae bacterium]